MKRQNQNCRRSTPKHQSQFNQVQSKNETSADPPGIDITETSELQVSHIQCESTDEETETENTLSFNMSRIEHEYETPFESNFYQKK